LLELAQEDIDFIGNGQNLDQNDKINDVNREVKTGRVAWRNNAVISFIVKFEMKPNTYNWENV
jgi:hypothetical protein